MERYALTQNGKQVIDHWGHPIIFDTKAAADEFLSNPPAMVGTLPPGVACKPTQSTRKAGNENAASFT